MKSRTPPIIQSFSKRLTKLKNPLKSPSQRKLKRNRLDHDNSNLTTTDGNFEDLRNKTPKHVVQKKKWSTKDILLHKNRHSRSKNRFERSFERLLRCDHVSALNKFGLRLNAYDSVSDCYGNPSDGSLPQISHLKFSKSGILASLKRFKESERSSTYLKMPKRKLYTQSNLSNSSLKKTLQHSLNLSSQNFRSKSLTRIAKYLTSSSNNKEECEKDNKSPKTLTLSSKTCQKVKYEPNLRLREPQIGLNSSSGDF
ncbi:unnamed protein product [Moneuplotes crassus]|uniref:Uncharacterized protein n=1 Tax=Euplotes crassus TaxID=5936 RepID=A0AAD1XH77_EUPCR|nr:unnamed protein product [Moneuplotes crassus]